MTTSTPSSLRRMSGDFRRPSVTGTQVHGLGGVGWGKGEEVGGTAPES